jgi:hypothetical protein
MNSDNDNQSILSDITTDNFDYVSSVDFLQKQEEIKSKTELELNKLTIDVLKEKCKETGLTNFSKIKKHELIQMLLTEFLKLCPLLKNKKTHELKNICKHYNIKNITGLKKFDLVWIILIHCSNNLIFQMDDCEEQEETTKETTKEREIKKISLIEELEKQKHEIETKMKEELEKQKQEFELKLKEEQKLIEEEKRKEREEAKKKKQSIPKNVRIIVWNHYIGEEIIKHRCLCCKKVLITNTNFEVGHVISEKNGGTHEINNLRPICFACNHSMGAENMIDFVVKFGLYIG